VQTRQGIKQFTLNLNTGQFSLKNVTSAATVQQAEAAHGVTTQDEGNFTVFVGN